MNDEKDKDLNPDLNNKDKKEESSDNKPDIDEVADSIEEESRNKSGGTEERFKIDEDDSGELTLGGEEEPGGKAEEAGEPESPEEKSEIDEIDIGELSVGGGEETPGEVKSSGETESSEEKPEIDEIDLGDLSLGDEEEAGEPESLEEKSEIDEIDVGELSVGGGEETPGEIKFSEGTEIPEEKPEIDEIDPGELSVGSEEEAGAKAGESGSPESPEEKPGIDEIDFSDISDGETDKTDEPEADISDDLEFTEIPDIDFGDDTIEKDEQPSQGPEARIPDFDEITPDGDLSEDIVNEDILPDDDSSTDLPGEDLSDKEVPSDSLNEPEELSGELDSGLPEEDVTLPDPDLPEDMTDESPDKGRKKSRLPLILLFLLIAAGAGWYLFIFNDNGRFIRKSVKTPPTVQPPRPAPAPAKPVKEPEPVTDPFIYEGATEIQKDISDGITTVVYETGTGIDEVYNYYKNKFVDMGYTAMSDNYRRGMSSAHIIYVKGEKTASIILRGTNQKVTALVQYIK